MSTDKTTISDSDSYRDIGEFWDDHDLSAFEAKTRPAEFRLDPKSSRIYVPLDRKTADELRAVAAELGITAEALLNRWLNEKIAERK
jgi:hypothetical protein